MYKIAVFASGSGSNLQAIINNIKSNYLKCKIEFIACDRQCFSIERAKNEKIKYYLFSKEIFFENIELILEKTPVDLIVLAGFLSIIPKHFISKWENKIINIHPSLLPKYGGKGMHGLLVHKAVLASNEHKSGCTVHYVDENIDSGKIILQKEVNIMPNDTPEILQKRILFFEHIILSDAIKLIIEKNEKMEDL